MLMQDSHFRVGGEVITMTVPVDTNMAMSRAGAMQEETPPCFEWPISVRTPYSSPFGLWWSSDALNVIVGGEVAYLYARSTGLVAPNTEIMFSGSAPANGNTTLCPQKPGDWENYDGAPLRMEIDATGLFTMTDLVYAGVMTGTQEGGYVPTGR
ncbi:hypothetical protein COV25_02070 [candidate division WWE3 bacterium CG10_big_fil_rev_8_21_14_0_10_35_32]|nr:MAG: hypothetical protein COV25_02070 [candidate division WWE3 bacterium CG10_big_fil_rev_8_21_14_0_10_35_32]